MGGVNVAVIGQCRGGEAEFSCSCAEGSGDGSAGNTTLDAQMEQEAGMVVGTADDLGVRAIGEAPVGEVGLPRLVGALGCEAPAGTARTFVWLRGDPPVAERQHLFGYRRAGGVRACFRS